MANHSAVRTLECEKGDPSDGLGLYLKAADQTYDLSFTRYPGFHCNTSHVTMTGSSTFKGRGYRVEVGIQGGEPYWSVDIDSDLVDSSSIASSRHTIKEKNKRALRHNYVAEAFGEETDRRLDSVFPKLGDDLDHLTPDFIYEHEDGTIYVVEVGTSRSNRVQSLEEDFKNKLAKYWSAVRSRVGRGCVVFTPVIVGINYVISNIVLHQKLVNELLSRMDIACAVENETETDPQFFQPNKFKTTRDEYPGMIMEELERIEIDDSKGADSKLKIMTFDVEEILSNGNLKDSLTQFGVCCQTARAELSSPVNHDLLVSQFIEEVMNKEDFMRKKKPVTGLPLVLTTRGKRPGLINRYTLRENKSEGIDQQYHSTMVKIWNRSLSQGSSSAHWKTEDTRALIKEALETDPKRIRGLEEARQESRSKYHRVNLSKDLSSSNLQSLQKDGLFAKKADNHLLHIKRMKEQQLSFSYDVDLNDIEQFVCREDLLERADYIPEENSHIKELVDAGNDLANNTGKTSELLSSWMDTKLFQSLDILSSIAMEVATSFKQHCKTGEFILKRLKEFEVYVLIHPTKGDSHTFFSVFIPKIEGTEVLCSLPFRPLHDVGVGYMSDFVSVLPSKVANLSTMSASVVSFASFYADFYSLSDLSPGGLKSHPEAVKMLLTTLLVRVEDKSETEETLTLSRYMYMEIFKAQSCVGKPNPFKILKKMTTRPRSRLNIWCMRRLIGAFTTMLANPPRSSGKDPGLKLAEGEESYPGDEWEDLINFITLGPLLSSTGAVNLMYLGYVKNKEEVPQGNSDWGLLEKVLEEEFSLDDSEEGIYKSLGYTKAEETPGPRQFSLNVMKIGCDVIAARLRRLKGPQWQKKISEEVCQELARNLTLEMSTLKASCPYDSKDTKAKVPSGGDPKVPRPRVIEGIAQRLGLMDVCPFLRYSTFLENLEKGCGGIIADLFKKMQHGGLREIYVLTIESRICQLFLESVGRVLCSYCEEETLTHPKNKVSLLDRHRVKNSAYSREADTNYITYCNSSDKKRWNQNFTMSALVTPLLRLTHPSLHGAIVRTINLWTHKFIKIPPSITKLLMEGTPLRSSVFEELEAKFHGRPLDHHNSMGVESKKAGFVCIATGMLQGILHNVSSLTHVVEMAACKYITLSYLKFRHPYAKFNMTSVCSSDDEATQLTVHIPRNSGEVLKNQLQAIVDTEMVLLAGTHFSKNFCMRESEKSTIGMANYIEFNSIFLLRNTIAMPIIKFVIASLAVTESSSMIKRFQNNKNLLSDLSSSGFPSLNSALCELAQVLVHYRLMGSVQSGVFEKYKNLLLDLPDPVRGFYPLDSEFAPGIMGLSYCLWQCLTRSPSLSRSSNKIDEKSVEVLSDGSVVESLEIRHGDHARWNRIFYRISKFRTLFGSERKKMDCKLEMKQEAQQIREKVSKAFKENPSLLFRDPENIEETKVRMLGKMLMPGVADSLKRGDSFVNSLQSSVYCLFTHSYTKVESELVGRTKQKIVKKVSLIGDLHQAIHQLGQQEPLTESTLEAMFPLIHRYREFSLIHESYKSSELQSVHRMRCRQTSVVLHPRSDLVPVTLVNCCKKKWFGFTIKASRSVTEASWNQYKAIIPWLRDSFEETLENSLFETSTELYGYISSHGSRARVFTKIGPYIGSNMFSTQVNLIMRKCYLRNKVLVRASRESTKVESSEEWVSQLALSLSIPVYRDRVSMVKKSMSRSGLAAIDSMDLGSLPRRKSMAAVIALFHMGKMTAQEVQAYVERSHHGTILRYTVPQKKVVDGDKIRWEGEGACIMVHDGVYAKLLLRDDKLMTITVNNTKCLEKNRDIINRALTLTGSTVPVYNLTGPKTQFKYNGSQLCPKTTRGVNVDEDPDMVRYQASCERMTSKIEPGCIRIEAFSGKDTYTIMSFRTLSGDTLMGEEKECVEDTFWGYWVAGASAPVGHCVDYLKRLQVSDESVKKDLQDWNRRTLKSRLVSLGYGQVTSSITDAASKIEEEGNELLDDEIMALLEEANEDDGGEEWFTSTALTDLLICGSEELNDDVRAAIDDDDPAYFQSVVACFQLGSGGNPSDSTISDRKSTNFLSSHPIWDVFIRSINEKAPNLLEKVLSGQLASEDEVTSRSLMEALAIEPRKTRQLKFSEIHMLDSLEKAVPYAAEPEERDLSPVLEEASIPEDSLEGAEGGEDPDKSSPAKKVDWWDVTW